MRKFENGYIDAGDVFTAVTLLFLAVFMLSLLALPFLRVQTSDELVSGIVYNNKNNTWPLGNTEFSIRASEDTYVTEENQSSYCLPNGSPYTELVKQASVDKDIKVVVTKKKVFQLAWPFTCVDNVEVTRKE